MLLKYQRNNVTLRLNLESEKHKNATDQTIKTATESL